MFKLLEKYKNPSLLLNLILSDFFENVNANKRTNHFFLEVKLKLMCSDVENFSHFTMNKAPRLYSNIPEQTSDKFNQVGSSVFGEIYNELVEVLRHHKINFIDIPQLSFEIMEIVEEARMQFRDDTLMIIDTESVSLENLIKNLSEYKIQSKFLGINEIILKTGLEFPTRIKLRAKDKTLSIKCVAVSIEKTKVEDLNGLITTCNEKYPFFSIKAMDDEDDWPFLYSEVIFSYSNGIPKRLLLRNIQYFSSVFTLCVKCDKDKLLQKID
jgi:hypothetical protein